jgi:hypothetical protein
MEIIVDLSSSKNIQGLKFKSSYYTDCILNIIDSIKEGSSCNICNLIGGCQNNNHYNFKINLITNKLNKDVEKIYQDIESFFSKKSSSISIITIRELNENKIIYMLKNSKYIILGSNIYSYFSAYENTNDIEDVIIIGFQYGFIKKNDVKNLKNYELYVSKNGKNSKFYIDNPLIKSEFLLISDLNYLKNKNI